MATFKVKNFSSKRSMRSAFERADFEGYVWAEDNKERGFKQQGFTPSFYDFEDGDEVIVVDDNGNEVEKAIFVE